METLAGFLTPYIYVGAEGIVVEGVKRIQKWERGNVVFTSPCSRVTVVGKGLEIEQRTADILIIKGKPSSITFEELKK